MLSTAARQRIRQTSCVTRGRHVLSTACQRHFTSDTSPCLALASKGSTQQTFSTPSYGMRMTRNLRGVNGSALSAMMENPFFQQVRWKRKDGNRFFMKERPPTKKQRKNYNRELKQKQKKLEVHGKPGSKAGARREWANQWKEDILNPPTELSMHELEKYTVDDALLDDLMGNTSSAQPTPEPKYLGHMHRKYFNRVADQMEDYRHKMKLLASGETGDMGEKELVDLRHIELPTDHDISLALRAYRDKEGTRKKPVGIVKALKHVLQDMGVPISAFGEETYSALLTCSQTPAEGRRIMQMMKQQQFPISLYGWSILVDVYAKVGDYKGCMEVHREMIAEGVKPTLPSFTSLLAACYKVCSDGRISHKVRAEAADTAWEQWQEMIIVGIEPDVMAYGAILRIMAARGRPERALGILEEMQQREVAPTTLCFTSALRAVSKSHATAIRYEHGFTRRNLRREFITSHHAKLAQAIVRLAENAEVQQDDGFIAALIGCAGVAGDLPTAKAIYVANQIRKLDQFRTIGSSKHLSRLRGVDVDNESNILDSRFEMLSDGKSVPITNHSQRAMAFNKSQTNPMSFGEREYGKDSRVLSAIMLACANAAGKNMVGSMWQGRENEGYLCENSIRLLKTPRSTSYEDDSIPGAARTDNLTWAGDEKDFDRRGDKRLSGKKFTGVYEDDDVAMTLDELDDTFSQYFVDDEGRRKPEYQATTTQDIWKKRYLSKSGINAAYGNEELVTWHAEERQAVESRNEELISQNLHTERLGWGENSTQGKDGLSNPKQAKHDEKKIPEIKEELYFDSDSMRWKTRPKLAVVETTAEIIPKDSGSTLKESSASKPQELHFDADERRWKVREDSGMEKSSNTSSKVDTVAQRAQKQETTVLQISEEDFAKFFQELKQEVCESGSNPNDIDEEEARELFAAFQNDVVDLMDDGTYVDDSEFLEKLARVDSQSVGNETSLAGTRRTSAPTGRLKAVGKSTSTATLDFKQFESFEDNDDDEFFAEDFDDYDDDDDDDVVDEDDAINRITQEIQSKGSLQETGPFFEETVEVMDDAFDPDLEELRALLPAFSEGRLHQVRQAFANNLGDPSLLDLIKISREIMPDYVTNTWLKQMSVITARYVMKQAIRDGVLDVHMLNGVLQLETSIGRLDRALEFHATEFAKNRLKPTMYSDRLVLQMLLENNRFSRALAFKECIEKHTRTLDLQSYGSLIDYCARRRQVGSAMLLLRECLDKHGGSQPGSAQLAQLRIAYRQAKGLDEKDLEALIGPDPIRWLKYGEAHLKREMSKKGRRDIRLAQDAHLRI